MLYMLELLRAEFHIGITLIILQRRGRAGGRRQNPRLERSFLAMLVHLSPEGGQVVSVLFLGFALMFTSPGPSPLSLSASWKKITLWSVLAKTHTSHPTSAIIKTAILYTGPVVFQGPDKRVCLCARLVKKRRLNSICATLTRRGSW